MLDHTDEGLTQEWWNGFQEWLGALHLWDCHTAMGQLHLGFSMKDQQTAICIILGV